MGLSDYMYIPGRDQGGKTVCLDHLLYIKKKKPLKTNITKILLNRLLTGLKLITITNLLH